MSEIKKKKLVLPNDGKDVCIHIREMWKSGLQYWMQFRAIAVKKDTCSIDNYYVGTVPCCHLQLGLFPTGSTSELFSIISSFGRPYMLESSAVLNPVTS